MEPSRRLREVLLVASSFGNDSLNNCKPPYTYVNRQARPPNNSKQKTIRYIIKEVVIIYDKNDIEPYKSRCLGHSKFSGRNPPLYCTITLIAVRGHQTQKQNKKGTII